MKLKIVINLRRVSSIFLVFLFSVLLYSQELNLKKRALKEFNNSNYKKAYSLFKQAVSEYPDDAEIYYYLGYSLHHILYDVPPREYDEKKSNEILKYLYKAVELNPDMGDAYYFIGVEHGTRALFYMRIGDTLRVKGEYTKAREKGGYPNWLLELNRNTLKSCDSNAILFTFGDALTHPIWYCQFVENYRKDITVVSGGLLNYTPYVKFVKNGLEGYFIPLPITWDEEKIEGMKLEEWKTKKIKIPLSEEVKERFNLSTAKEVIEWELKPDYMRDSVGFLNPSTALILDVIKNNRWKRPVYFTLVWPENRMPKLGSHLQLCGLTYRLLPVDVKEYRIEMNLKEIERVLLDPESYRYISTVKDSKIPYCSHLLQYYQYVLRELAKHYIDNGDYTKGLEIMEKMEKYMPEEVSPYSESFREYKAWLQDMLWMKRVREFNICQTLFNTMENKGIDAASRKYYELRENHGEAVDLCESLIQERGTNLLIKNKSEDAIRAFKLNVVLFPKSYRAYYALANAYMKAGKKELAIENYKKSLKLNPDNKNAIKMLLKLEKAKRDAD